MTTLLQIDASIRGSASNVPEYNSISRSISATFMNEWQQHKPNDTVICRDVGMHPPDHITQDWIAAVFTAPENRSDTQNALLAQSDCLIAELEQADVIVLSTPMYNYGMPAVLKAWFDQVMRINKTFSFDLARGDYPIEPILSGKKLVAITSSGEFGFEPGGVREGRNHLMPHIKTLKEYLGVDELFEVAAEYQEFNDERHKTSVQDAHAKARDLAAKLALLN